MRTRASFLIAALAIGGTVLGAILATAGHKRLQPVLPWLLGLAIALCIGVFWPTRDRGAFKVKLPLDERRSFKRRWLDSWFIDGVIQKKRLWKTGLTKTDLDDVNEVANNATNKERVQQVLLGRMYLAHYRNNDTLTRRADLLKVASLLVLVFFIFFSFWLPSATSLTPPSTPTAKHSSLSPTVFVTATVTVTAPMPTILPTPTIPPPPTEPGRG